MKIGYLNKLDRTLFISVVVLMLIGLAIVFSTSHSSSGNSLANFYKQFTFIIFGIIILIATSFFNYRALKNYSGVFYVCACFALVLVLVFGSNIRGTESWFNLGYFNLQPSEFIKVIMVIILAKYLSKAGASENGLKKFIISGIYVFIPVLLIIIQPDLGSSLVILFTWISMVAISGITKKQIIILLCLASVVLAVSWNFLLKDYQKKRINVFFNIQSDPKGAGYNVNQSIIAIGSGEIWGKGLGHGSQSQLNFLPEKHTDFIFAVIAEEMGLIGVLFVLGLFSVIFYRLLKIINESHDNFGKYLVIGSSLMIFFHVLINIGMNMGIMPVTGIPLPFVSYGGSSLISFMLMLGIVQNIYKKGRGYKFGKDDGEI